MYGSIMYGKKQKRDISVMISKTNENIEAILGSETEKWRSKMIKVFGDLEPYCFYITYGHSDESQLKDRKVDILSREKTKAQAFENLENMHEVDREAEEEFHKVLSDFENKGDVEHLNEFLEERKKECAKVFDQFDRIVALCEEYLNLEYSDCKRRVREQMAIQKPMVDEVERYLTEVQEAGDKEISLLKDNIANYIREVGLTRSSKLEEIYADMDSQPLIMEVWSKCAEAITSREVWYSFLKMQQDTAHLWKKAFDDLMMLSTELERYRYNYNMTKSNLERAIYWMNRNYRDNMPELTKIQRKIAFLMDRKSDLFKELFNVEQKILKEKAAQKTLKLKYYNKVASMRLSVKLGNARILSKHNTVFESKRMEILDLLQAIVNGDHYIHEVLLDKPWSGTLDLSFLEKESNEQKMISNYETQLSAVMLTRKLISALNEDEFARAYRVFICNGDFVSVLNHVAEELGYMLDFQWVDYVKKTLEIEQEVRWLELFKVFKINFVEDIQDLKDHMKHFSKRHGDSVVFDLNGVLDGFLHFVWLKRQSINSQDLSLDEKEATYEVHEEFWKTVDKIIPKSLLWESVFELLETYRKALQSRKRLLSARFDMVLENEELDKYLENYYNYDIPK